ncbi:hypothetical protein QYE76_031932 [Lolium multiflorum]|uniref:Uncharacterized protein n=1 Tax=Lolium multiflorum TaxID=4521 RepID=A0AAD8QUH7_LOLMU|nr:hypothetical protein QYE76_031932 [Lolium multiflorum]
MAVKVKPLDDGVGYIRWKESMLLRLRIVRVAHVLTEDPPAGDEGGAPAAAKQWAHDDALCRGYILATLSDRVFPDYVRHATARELWDAVARTYDVGTSQNELQRMLREIAFDVRAPLLEQVAHAEALGARLVHSFGCLAYHLRSRHPVLIFLLGPPSPHRHGRHLEYSSTLRRISRLA